MRILIGSSSGQKQDFAFFPEDKRRRFDWFGESYHPCKNKLPNTFKNSMTGVQQTFYILTGACPDSIIFDREKRGNFPAGNADIAKENGLFINHKKTAKKERFTRESR